jgi:hypothetical protein
MKTYEYLCKLLLAGTGRFSTENIPYAPLMKSLPEDYTLYH